MDSVSVDPVYKATSIDNDDSRTTPLDDGVNSTVISQGIAQRKKSSRILNTVWIGLLCAFLAAAAVASVGKGGLSPSGTPTGELNSTED